MTVAVPGKHLAQGRGIAGRVARSAVVVDLAKHGHPVTTGLAVR